MSLLYQQLAITDKNLQKIVAKAGMSILTGRHVEDYDPEMPLTERKYRADEFVYGLKFLQENEIIRYSINTYMGKHLSFSVTVTNRYKLEQLMVELNWLEYHPDALHPHMDKEVPRIDDAAYYERSTGNIIINGKRKTLKNTNRKLFDALFIANPGFANRNELLKVIGTKKREQSSKISLNEAFSNLRKACGVTSHTIGLGQEGGRLNASTFQLSDEADMYFSNFHSD